LLAFLAGLAFAVGLPPQIAAEQRQTNEDERYQRLAITTPRLAELIPPQFFVYLAKKRRIGLGG